MNKLAKATIAATFATALLLGGAGTLASWNSSANVSGGTIVAGNLVVTEPTPASAGVWTANGAAVDLASFRAVPGDALVLTKTMHITATGNNLVATLGITPGSITAPATGATAADTALAAYLTSTATLTATGTGISGSNNVFTVTAGTAGVDQDVTVAVTITFPKNATAGFGAEASTKLGTVSLAALAISLTQN